jgi:hypothetical protein
MVSFYYHTKKLCGTDAQWLNALSEAQLERLCSGDMEGWFEQLYKEGGARRKAIPLQYRYIDQNVDNAIALVQGDFPHVYVLIHECFEESLRFMEVKFSLRSDATDMFLQSGRYHTRNNQAKYRNEIDTALLSKLRKKYEEWWPDDYRFYNAAVSQFQQNLASIQFDSSTVHSSKCPYVTGRGQAALGATTVASTVS